ncbi:MAG: hypothetical protein JHD28_07285 [Bacteroidia bacterium]|nr:hypothetical protein [Bacteroidia bacterium]
MKKYILFILVLSSCFYKPRITENNEPPPPPGTEGEENSGCDTFAIESALSEYTEAKPIDFDYDSACLKAEILPVICNYFKKNKQFKTIAYPYIEYTIDTMGYVCNLKLSYKNTRRIVIKDKLYKPMYISGYDNNGKLITFRTFYFKAINVNKCSYELYAFDE